ncbi:peptidoglycan -binding protein [Antarcticimicrobium sediminis]|uniref:Peptidoglycan-binding protein n=1 Tax=Antarcticimicrobium sediminis TaxID=2546227 RepID=A0A4R5EPE8_9RHOB|nr:peptidoglycan -binding protein [Antarcticimicrobium sediminis]TDE36625.1 peptidoglycan -binding protein [Antarcticimicrobium sediminis]
MALSRRTGQRFQGSIWPGFVDAMTGLLLVLMFVLTIFMMVMFVLRETITGQETELDALSAEVNALASALGLEERTNAQLSARMGALTATLNETRNGLNQAKAELDQRASLITTLTAERDQQSAALDAAQGRIASFEEQVASLLAEQTRSQGQIAALTDEKATLVSQQEALNLALASHRAEIDAQVEAARLAAARREALEAMVADLRQQGADQAAEAQALTGRLTELESQLSDEEQARLAEAAAAEALRDKLKTSDAELTAMTMDLERQRKAAEDTLTLLAAAEAARDALDQELLTTLSDLDSAKTGAADRDALAARLERVLAQMETVKAQGDDKVNALAAELAQAKADLSAAQMATDQAGQDRATVEARLAQALEALEQAQSAGSDRAELQRRLLVALAAKDTAEQQAAEQMSESEARDILLAKARDQLSEQEAISTEAQRQTALLNQQVAALRGQLGSLQALLDDYKDRDTSQQVQLQNLGQDLNTALARAASEERRRRLLEEAERKRLEVEAKLRIAETDQLKEQAKDLERYRSDFFGRLREVLGTQEGVRIQGDRFVFSSEVLFAPGETELAPAGKAEIAKIARILRSIAAEIPPEINWVIRVDGHTDTVPVRPGADFADNWELSQARALSVVRYLVDAQGISPGRLAANGFGEYQPINPANTPEARAQNRRIELKLTEK